MPGFELFSFIFGFFTAIGSKIFINSYYKPILKIPHDAPLKVNSSVNLLILRQNEGEITQDEQKVPVMVYRIKVINEGKTAAKNVCGTIEFYDTQAERRICWYEGSAPSITINTGDHSFLDVYGVIIENRRFTNAICMPTENGWEGLKRINVTSDWKIKIRVTAENAKPERKEFKINHMPPCELEFIEKPNKSNKRKIIKEKILKFTQKFKL